MPCHEKTLRLKNCSSARDRYYIIPNSTNLCRYIPNEQVLSVEKRGALTLSESLTLRQIKDGYHRHTSFYHDALSLINCRLRQFCKMNAFPRYLFPKLNFPKNEFALRRNPFMRILDQRSTTVSQWVTLEGILAIK